MSFRLPLLLVATACLAPSILAAAKTTAAAPAGVTVHVAPTGDDRAPVTAERPLRTLAAAQSKVRQLPRTGPITGHLAPGIYRLAETLRFTSEDSGTPTAPIIWLGRGWTETVVSGGRALTDWQRSAAHPHRWQASVPNGTRFNQLWIDGKRAVRTRTPNTDYLYLDTPGTCRRAQPGGRSESQHQLRDAGFVYRAADAARVSRMRPTEASSRLSIAA